MWTKRLRPRRVRIDTKYSRRAPIASVISQSRQFHEYFITHLPSSSHHPDQRPNVPHHKLPRDQSTPHDPAASNRPAATSSVGVSRDLTVVRIPLKSAKHHFGASSSRGQRPYNEDEFQAGTIDLPAFARRRPVSVTRRSKVQGEPDNPASTKTGDPQVFYFAVFDGHGGSECSEFLKERLHAYIEDSANEFGLESSLTRIGSSIDPPEEKGERAADPAKHEDNAEPRDEKDQKAVQMQRSLVRAWRDLVGGYFRRFKPEFFSASGGGQEQRLIPRQLKSEQLVDIAGWTASSSSEKIETVLEWAFLKADFDFIAAQVAKPEENKADAAINDSELSDRPSQVRNQIGGPKRFLGGSTCSVALVSTPTPTPFWHPQATSTLITAHCGDTRILLCDTASGKAVAITATHHPDHPLEAQRMRRYAATFVTDSFGEERVAGLANTRAFGDMSSKRIGVSAEPEIVRVELDAAQYSFMVLVSDGISGQLSDQEIVDIVKEARTPEQGAKDVVGFATEITTDGDNATAIVLRLGGWERREEGGGGSLRTKEARDFKRKEALDPRSRHM